jgi:hypothetical protein
MTTTASFLSDFWNDQLVEHDRQWVFLVLLGLVLSFGLIRMSTRLMRSPRVPWWPGSIVSEGGVHVHHLVFGIVLMMVAGTISFAWPAISPVYEICALGLGIGIGLTIDEFALWVHLEDVYWAREGRSSIDAAVIAATMMGLVVLGVRPFDVETATAGAVVGTIVDAVLAVAVVVICFLKGRRTHGIVGFLVQPLALYGACRLAKPDSAWARHRYGDRDPAKQARAEERFAPGRRTDRFKDRLRDLLGGVTEEEYEAKLGQRPEPASPPSDEGR